MNPLLDKLFITQLNPSVVVKVTFVLLILQNSGNGKPEGSRRDNNVGHAPCYDCEMYNVMHADQPQQAKQVGNMCHCKCPNEQLQCKAGVNTVRDGCDCCFICARQQGDLCTYRDKCDEKKGLYCDFQMGDGYTGICRAKMGKNCEVDGKIYKDGDQFKPTCTKLCSCQNGNYACTSECPQEERPPSSIHCKVAILVSISGRCCKEWVCPNSHSLPEKEDEFSPPREYSDDWKAKVPSTVPANCKRETSAWDACSVSCGMGVSTRVSNDNEKCQPVQEKRLCFIRPCDSEESKKKGSLCKNIWRPADEIQFQYKGCTSVKKYRPKYCSTCKRRRCCVPAKTRTNPMEWQCENGKIIIQNFMWIKSCVCTDECP